LFLIAMVICITDALKRLLMQHVMVDLIFNDYGRN
jgi:hypothetical protein